MVCRAARPPRRAARVTSRNPPAVVSPTFTEQAGFEPTGGKHGYGIIGASDRQG